MLLIKISKVSIVTPQHCSIRDIFPFLHHRVMFQKCSNNLTHVSYLISSQTLQTLDEFAIRDSKHTVKNEPALSMTRGLHPAHHELYCLSIKSFYAHVTTVFFLFLIIPKFTKSTIWSMQPVHCMSVERAGRYVSKWPILINHDG